MTEHVEREPAPRRQATYPGDHRHLLGDGQWLGPDRRGILWRPCHADYNLAKNQTVVIFAPVAPHEVDRVPGLRDRLNLLQQQQASLMGGFARIGEQP